MERFVVVGDVEARRVIAQSTQRAVAASVCRLEPIVDRSTQVYLYTEATLCLHHLASPVESLLKLRPDHRM